jgi:hypothetical protein
VDRFQTGQTGDIDKRRRRPDTARKLDDQIGPTRDNPRLTGVLVEQPQSGINLRRLKITIPHGASPSPVSIGVSRATSPSRRQTQV